MWYFTFSSLLVSWHSCLIMLCPQGMQRYEYQSRRAFQILLATILSLIKSLYVHDSFHVFWFVFTSLDQYKHIRVILNSCTFQNRIAEINYFYWNAFPSLEAHITNNFISSKGRQCAFKIMDTNPGLILPPFILPVPSL